MRRWNERLGLAVGIVALAMTTACGGSGTGSEPDVAVSGSPSAPAGASASTASSTPTETAGAPQETATTEPDVTEQAVVPAGPSEPVRVTYRISGAAAAATPEDIVVSFDPPRSAMLFRGGHVIDEGPDGGTVFCTEESGDPQCFELPPELTGVDNPFLAGLLGSFWVLQSGEGAPALDWSETREVAGRDARCATLDPGTVEPAAAASEAHFCVDTRSGVGLHYEVTDPDGGVTTINAVEVGAPTAADFTPEVAPEPLPTP